MLAWISVAFADPLVAVVVIDEAAREQGYALELEDLVVDDALPIDVAVGEHVQIVDPDGQRFELDVEPGEAWEVTGPQAEAWMNRIGEDVRSDVLVVRGAPDAIRSLADALDAEVRHENGQTLLIHEGILFAAPWAKMTGLDRIDEVSLVRAPTAIGGPVRRVTLHRAPAVVRPRVAVPRTPSVPKAPITPKVAPPVPALPAPVVTIDVAPAPTEDSTPVPKATPARRDPLDPSRYFGAWLCSDGNVAILSAGGFAAAGVQGSWRVSAPGVVRLEVEGALFGRVAFGGEGDYCRAVWRS
jgi:hypothetical protein